MTLTMRDAPATEFPIARVRDAFPALRAADGFVFFDNAAGAQIPDQALQEVNRHLVQHNVQRGGRYARSVEVDRAISRARSKIADFLGAGDPREVCLGMNATSFIRQVSLAIGQSRNLGRSEIVVTDMDHEANIATWRALQSNRTKIRWWRMRDDGRLHVEDLKPLLSRRTRLVACTAASHAMGSRVDVAAAASAAHSVGAELFLDAVHYAPHGPIDVKAWGCDYLVCSGYKIFGPHMGFLWGRFAALTTLPTFREDFIPDEPPHKIEAGTFVYENVSGMSATLDYLAALGAGMVGAASLRERLGAAMNGILAYERELSARMLGVLREIGATVYGVADPDRVVDRVPTFLFNLRGLHPAQVAEAAAKAGFGIRDGHMYAPHLMARLGLDMDSGAVRVSLSHYNTLDEIDRFGDFLRRLAG
ncbi:MAG TPA: cysteine desulfurase-like protein [Caulobacteraceae bacterium]|jgi:cysteine desulfurase family protein (TIGR01976 family)